MGTSLWLSQQAAEKYMKCVLLKRDSSCKIEEYRHILLNLWKDTKEFFSKENTKNNKGYDDFLKELNTVDVNSRYGLGIDMEKIWFIGKFIDFGDDMRKLILKKDYSKRGFHSLPNSMLHEGVREIVCPLLSSNGRSLLAK